MRIAPLGLRDEDRDLFGVVNTILDGDGRVDSAGRQRCRREDVIGVPPTFEGDQHRSTQLQSFDRTREGGFELTSELVDQNFGLAVLYAVEDRGGHLGGSDLRDVE